MKRFFMLTILGLLCGMQSYAMDNITVNGTKREMIVYAPKNLPQQAPLVIACHGYNQDAAYLQGKGQTYGAHWEEVADTAKFVVVYANGINKAWDIDGMSDVNFMLAIIDEMDTRYGIDRNRVYLTGFSMGGMFTYHCANKIADRIAAFAPVSGYRMAGPNATASRAVPLIHTHGTGDDVCSYSAAPTHVKAWAQFDGCDATPVTYKPYPVGTNSPAKMEVYRNGRDGVEVALLTLDGKGHWWSRDEAQAHTTREVWNFCKRYSLGAPEPTVKSISPEERSFDLDAATDTLFTLLLSDTVDCSKAKAELKAENFTLTLNTLSEGWGKELRFTLPSGAEDAKGTYTLAITEVVSKAGTKMRAKKYTYAYGVEEVGPVAITDTVFTYDLRAEQEQIKEGIPSGWVRTMSGSSTETIQGPKEVTGVRLKYFEKGGDFNEGFYLSARDYTTATLTYGSVAGYRLSLPAGDYTASFRSTYWSQGAMTNKATFSFSITTSTGTSYVSASGLPSSNTMDEKTDHTITNSYLHTIDFTVPAKAIDLIKFEMSEGWNSVIVGDIIITTQPSLADKYKGSFYRTWLAANAALQGYEGVAVENLQKVIDQYANFVSTSPTQYTAARQALEKAISTFKASPEKTTALEAIESLPCELPTATYNLAGQRTSDSSHGLLIQSGHKRIVK